MWKFTGIDINTGIIFGFVCIVITYNYRYISGKRPEYARKYSESESEDEEEDFIAK
jgi:hypothetical protein